MEDTTMADVLGTNAGELINGVYYNYKSGGTTWGDDNIFGYGGDDTIWALSGDDYIWGGTGADTIYGGYGTDTAMYTTSAERVIVNLETGYASGGEAEGDILNSIENLQGSFYNDVLVGNAGANELIGHGGKDVLKGGGGADLLDGGTGDDSLVGGAGDDKLYGGNDADILYGDGDSGPAGHDILFGGSGSDTLIGGSGFMDIMNGGTWADTFKFSSAAECGLTAASADQLPDFNESTGDKIDLSGFDANENLAGKQTFDFIGNDNAFTEAGQVRYNTAGYVEGNTDSDADPEFYIAVNNVLTPVMHDFGFVL
jgi:Ca2+-binding RTX toxin-like protein